MIHGSKIPDPLYFSRAKLGCLGLFGFFIPGLPVSLSSILGFKNPPKESPTSMQNKGHQRVPGTKIYYPHLRTLMTLVLVGKLVLLLENEPSKIEAMAGF